MDNKKKPRPRMMQNQSSFSDFTKDEPWRIFRIMAEFVDSFETMANQGPLIPIFGSARIKPDNPFYQSAEKLAALLVQHGYGVLTGGGIGRNQREVGVLFACDLVIVAGADLGDVGDVALVLARDHAEL